MPKIKFDFAGQTFKADVADSFLQREKSEQARILKEQLVSKYETRIPPRGSDDKGVLDYLALIERPAQALKVGLKESDLGGNVFRGLGGVDLTPEEGFWTGASRGWLGEDEVRTQDFLPDDMDPLLKGVLGFAGDVATDPLTWYAPALVRGGSNLVKAHTPKAVVNTLNRAKDTAMSAKFGEKQRGLADIARMFNMPVGEGRRVKGRAQVSNQILRERDKEITRNLPKLQDFFKERGATLGESSALIERTFRDTLERAKLPEFDKLGKPILNEEGYIKYTTESVPITTEQRELLGKDGLKLVPEWEGLIKEWAAESKSFGMPFDELEAMGYFPRVITEAGRRLLESRKSPLLSDFELDDMGNVVYRAGYRGHRRFMPDKTVTEVNDEMARALGESVPSSRPNPAERPYEFQFFEESPFVALGERWSRQNRALQRKWFIDEITDNFRATGPMLTNTLIQNARNALLSKGVPEYELTWDIVRKQAESMAPVKAEMGIGKWVKRDPEGGEGQFVERYINPGEGDKYLWRKADDVDIADNYVEVKGLPNQSLTDEALNDEWLKVWNEQMELRGLDPSVASSFARYKMTAEEAGTLPAQYMEVKALADAAVQRSELMGRAVFVAPKQISRQIEDHLSLMSGNEVGEGQLRDFLRFYDQTQNAWKAWTLGVRPAYHTRNALGNVLNAYNITGLGENIPEAVRVFTAAAKLQYYSRFRGDPTKQAELLDKLSGVRQAVEGKLPTIESGLWNADDFFDTGYSMERLYEEALDRGVNAGHYTADSIRDYKQMLQAQAGTGKKWRRIIGAENPAVQKGFLIGGTIEGNARFAVFLNTLRKIKENPSQYKWTTPDGDEVAIGSKTEHFKVIPEYDYRGNLRQRRVPIEKDDMIFDVAAQEVKKGLFDYSDVSRFERDVLKRFMPFYTWTRKNIPAQLVSLVKNPQRAEKLAIAKAQFEHESGDLDHSDYGAFWGDRVPIFFGNETQGVIKAFTLLNVVPMADLQRMIRPGPLLAEMTSPMIKAPLEILANYDTFRKGKPVKAFPGEMKDYLGVSLPPRLWHLAQVIVPLTEINRLNPAGVFGERMKDPLTGKIASTAGWGGVGAMRETTMDAPEIARWIRFFSGGTVYDVDLHKNRYIANRNLLKDAAELKGKMKWAYANTQNERAGRIEEVLNEVLRQEITDPFDRR
jgi:hypothetical protein